MVAIYKTDQMVPQEETFYLYTVYVENTPPAVSVNTWVCLPSSQSCGRVCTLAELLVDCPCP